MFDKDTREPLPGVTVMIEGSQQGTATNANGEFIFPIDSGNYNIIFSFIGYERLVKKFNGNNSAEFREIQLAPAVETIEDVVVTGIYRRKKESFTGSASTYKVEDLKAAGTQNVLQSIRTLDPSFKINVNNQFGSDPNRLPDVEIRGKSSVMGFEPTVIYIGRIRNGFTDSHGFEHEPDSLRNTFKGRRIHGNLRFKSCQRCIGY